MELIDNRPYGNLAQSNHFGLMMVLSVIAATALYEMRVLSSGKVYSMVAGFFGWGVLMSQSRASAIALLCTVVCLYLTRRRVDTRLRLWPVLGGLVVWVLLWISMGQIQEFLGLNEKGFRNILDGGVRPAMWHHFWTSIMAHPWLGYGFNQGVAALAEVATQLPPSETRSTVYAHNFVLDLMVWGGIPLALILTGTLVAWMAGWLKKREDKEWQMQCHLVFAVWLALVIQSSLEYPYAYAYFLLPAALLAGVITPFPATAAAVGAPVRHYVASRWAMLLGAVTAALLGAVVWDYASLEGDFRMARFARQNYIGRPHHDYLTDPLVLDLLATMNQTALRKLSPGMTPDEIKQMHDIARRVQNPAVQIDYAKTLALNGRMPEAQHELDILRSLYSPSVFVSIDKEWKEWLADNKARLPN